MDYFHLCADQDTLSGLSMLALAHLGDAVYELMVRSWLCLHGQATNKGLHQTAVTYVSAPAQASRAEKLQPALTEAERAIYRRGRNSHTSAAPKGASVAEYHAATALEALFGWLYLQGCTDRLNELFTLMMED